MTKRVSDIVVLSDLDAETNNIDNTTRTMIVTSQDSTGSSAPVSGAIVGQPRPQAAQAVRVSSEQRGVNYVELGVVVHPNSQTGFFGEGNIIPSTGRSSVVVQLSERPEGFDQGGATISRDGGTPAGPGEPEPNVVDVGPWSHQLRVVDSALCLLGNDPQEHHPADPQDRTGGGFLAFHSHTTPTKMIRTRTGDIWAPMKPGLPRFPSGNSSPLPQGVAQGGEPAGSGGTTIPRFLDPFGLGQRALDGAKKVGGLLGSVLDNE